MDRAGSDLLAFASVPLILSYISFPLVDMATLAMGRETFRSWIDIAWLFLAVLALLQCILRLARPDPAPHIPRTALAAVPIVVIILIASIIRTGYTGFPFAMELKPLFYAAVAWLWVWAYGLPTKRAFVHAGLWLSAIIVSECIFRSIAGGTLIRPIGSGEVNYDACLIVLSLCVALADNETPGFYVVLLFAGIFTTFSRTGLTAATIVLLVSRRVPVGLKAGAVGVALAGAVASTLSRNLELSLEQVDRYFMWLSAIELFTTHPSGLLSGYGIGAPLPAAIFPQNEGLWEAQSENLGLSGVYAFEYHAMWLRLLISWGGLIVVLVLLTVAMWAFQKRTSLGRFLAIVVFLEGFTMGVIYLSNVAVPIWMLLLSVARELAPRLKRVKLRTA